MTILQRSCGDVVVLDLAGNLSTTDSARPVRTAVESVVRDHRTDIILNMNHAPYIDSTGLADLIEAFHVATRAGGSLKLTHFTPRVRGLLALRTLLNVFETFDTEAGALASFEGALNPATTIT